MSVSRCPRFAKRVLGVLGIALVLVLAGTTPAQAGEFFEMAEKEYDFRCHKDAKFLKAGGKWPTFGIEFLAYCSVFEGYRGAFKYPKEWVPLLVKGSYTYPDKPGKKTAATERIFRVEAKVLDPVTKKVETTEKLVVEVRMQCTKNPWVSGAPCEVTKTVNNTGVDVSGPKPESTMALDHSLRKALAEWEARKGQTQTLDDLLADIAPIVVPAPDQIFATKEGWIQLGPTPPKGVGLYELEWESARVFAGKTHFRPQSGILDKLAAGKGQQVTFPQEGRWRVRAVNPTWNTKGEWREFWVGAPGEAAQAEYSKQFKRKFQVRRADPSRLPARTVPSNP